MLQYLFKCNQLPLHGAMVLRATDGHHKITHFTTCVHWNICRAYRPLSNKTDE